MSKLLKQLQAQKKRDNGEHSNDVLKLYHSLIANNLSSQLLFSQLTTVTFTPEGDRDYKVKDGFISLIENWNE